MCTEAFAGRAGKALKRAFSEISDIFHEAGGLRLGGACSGTNVARVPPYLIYK